jgi:ribonuclease E
MLRMIEEMLLKGGTHNLVVRTRTEVALYALNHKRAHLRDLESRFQITITINADATVGAAQPFLIEKGEQVHSVEAAKALLAKAVPAPAPIEDEDDDHEEVEDEAAEDESETVGEAEGDSESDDAEAQAEGGEPSQQREGGARRRRRRRGRGRDRDREPREPGAQREGGEFAHETAAGHQVTHASDDEAGGEGEEREASGEPRQGGEQEGDGERRRRRRGRRGGRRNRRGREGEEGFQNGGQSEHQEATESGVEPEVADAVSDLDGAPREAVPAPSPVHSPEPFEPVARDPQPQQPVEAAPAEAAPPPKRRSTIREAAPVFSAGAMSDVQPPQASAPSPVHEATPVPEAQPAPEAAPEAAAEAKPRRFGWWSKRG